MHLTNPAIELMINNGINQVKDFSITLLNMQGVFLYWNEGAVLLDGYEPQEIVGKPLNTLHPKLEKKEKLDEYLLSSAAREGRAKHIGKRLKKDGSTYWASVVLNAIFDGAGEHIGYIRIAHEIWNTEE